MLPLADFPNVQNLTSCQSTYHPSSDYLRGLLSWLIGSNVALPTLVFQLDMLNGDGICVGIKVRKGLVFRDPTAIDFVGDRQLTGLIVHFNDQVLAKILECDLLTQASTLQPDLARPLLEGVIVGDAALEGNGIVLGAPRRFTAAAGIAALAVLHHLGGTLQGTDLADSGN